MHEALTNAAEQFIAWHKVDGAPNPAMLDYFAEIFGEALASLPSLPEGEPELPRYRFSVDADGDGGLQQHPEGEWVKVEDIATPTSLEQASAEYFGKRPQIDTMDRRNVFKAGFECAALAAGRAEPENPSLDEEIARLQTALAFWLPNVPDADHPLYKRIADDSFLLLGLIGPNDEKCAQDLGHIALSAAPSQPVGSALTDERIRELWTEHGLDECDPEGFARIIEREVLAALTPEPAALPAEVEGLSELLREARDNAIASTAEVDISADRRAYRRELAERLNAARNALAAPAQPAPEPAAQAAAVPEAAARDAARLSSLLARIHRDGGHYEGKHGTGKACEDAEVKVIGWLQRDDRLAAPEAGSALSQGDVSGEGEGS